MNGDISIILRSLNKNRSNERLGNSFHSKSSASSKFLSAPALLLCQRSYPPVLSWPSMISFFSQNAIRSIPSNCDHYYVTINYLFFTWIYLLLCITLCAWSFQIAKKDWQSKRNEIFFLFLYTRVTEDTIRLKCESVRFWE